MTPRRARSKEAGEPAADAAAEPRFEQALAELESLVHKLESGELDLEQALGTFEAGVALAKLCSARLEAAELRIAKLEAVAGATLERGLELGDDE